MGRRGRKRGLFNLKSTPEALPQFIAEKNVDLFLKHHIFTKEEIHSRYEILLENYVKTIQLESKTMQEMLSKDFLPAVSRFAGEVSKSVLDKKALLPSIKQRKNWLSWNLLPLPMRPCPKATTS